jgi:hypothetical protein
VTHKLEAADMNAVWHVCGPTSASSVKPSAIQTETLPNVLFLHDIVRAGIEP